MSKTGPVILIEDDLDDQEITKEVIAKLGIKNEIISFYNCDDAYQYLLNNLNVQPFIILCDVNMPGTNGIELKARIDNTTILRQKSIPFVFHSTSADKPTVTKAYNYTVQGFFLKENSMKEMAANLKLIFDYWSKCKHPNN